MTDISSPSVPASQNSTGEPAAPSGPHVASMSITVVQSRGTIGLVRVGSAIRSAEHRHLSINRAESCHSQPVEGCVGFAAWIDQSGEICCLTCG